MEWLVRTDTFSPLFFPNFYVLSVFSNCWFSSPPSVCLSAPVCVRLPCLLFFFFVRPPVLRELFWVFSCWFSAPLYVFPVSSFSCFWVSPLLLVLPFFFSSSVASCCVRIYRQGKALAPLRVIVQPLG